MSELRDAMARLSPEQRAELEAQLTKRRPESANGAIRERSDLSTHPISSGQARIFAMCRVRPDRATYNLQQTYHVHGPIDAARLDAALVAVVGRHDALRARFELVDGEPVQTIDMAPQTVLETVDLTALPTAERLDAAHALAREQSQHAFDLARGGLFRARLVGIGAEEHMLVLSAHHIVCDGWSMNVIEGEMSALYGGAELPEPSIQSSDVAAWEDTRAEQLGADLDWWRGYLDGVEPLSLPTGSRQRDAAPEGGGHHLFVVSSDVAARTQELSRAARVTPHIVLLAAFAILLNRGTGQEDLVVCSPAAGRSHPATHGLVGYFNNVVATRADLSGNPTFREIVERVRRSLAGAIDHEGAPFQDVGRLAEVRGTRLTRALFVLQEIVATTLDLAGATLTPVEIETDSADFDLSLFARLGDEGYRVVVTYQQRLFSPADIDLLAATYEQLLSTCLDNPEQRLAELPTWTAPSVPDEPDDRATRAAGGPQTLLESQLREIWEDVFRQRPISVHDDFFELGGHSLLAAVLMHEIEQRVVEEPLPLAALFRAPTIAELAALIEARGWDTSWSSLVPIQPNGERGLLFFVHAHGGNVIGFYDLARRLGQDQPFYGLQSPHVDASSEPARLEDIAAAYISEIRTVQRSGPYLLGGWCLGGDLAFEMAQQLRRGGEDVALVVMVDNPRPGFVASEHGGWLGQRVASRVGSRTSMEWSNLLELPASERPRYLTRRMRRVAELLTVRGEGVLDRAAIRLPHSRAYRERALAEYHEKAYQDYSPRAYEGRVALVRAEHQPLRKIADSTLGWDSFLIGERDLIEAPGHRIGLLSEPRVEAVSGLIRDAIDRALAAESEDF